MSPAPTTKALLVAGAVVSALVAGGCAVSPGSANLVNGKKQFVAKCGSCHTLARAGTTGIVGPNLTHVGSRLTIAAGIYPQDGNP